MADTDQREDEVLRRMLATPPQKHKPLGKDETGRPTRKPQWTGQLGWLFCWLAAMGLGPASFILTQRTNNPTSPSRASGVSSLAKRRRYTNSGNLQHLIVEAIFADRGADGTRVFEL